MTEEYDPGQLTNEIKNALLNEGASLVGFADVRCIPAEFRQSMEYAVSLGVALNPAVVARIAQNGPGMEYSYEKVRAGQFLNYLAEFGAKFLVSRGYEAFALRSEATPGEFNPQTFGVSFQHKTAATRAGLGWIGKSALLITREYGPALRLNTILTNAALECGTPIEAPDCGDCRDCVDACPAKAITGNQWDVTKCREDLRRGRSHLLDAMGCGKYYTVYNQKLGIQAPEARICGFCMAACPYTKRYSSGHKREMR